MTRPPAGYIIGRALCRNQEPQVHRTNQDAGHHGYQNVVNLLGGMTAWNRLSFPVAKGRAQPHRTLEAGRSQSREIADL